MLTLQLRVAEKEAVEAEAALEALDPMTSTSELGAVLDPLVSQRRAELDREFAAARGEAATEIAAAHQQVAEWLDEVNATPADSPMATTVVPTIPGGANSAAPFDVDGFARSFAASFAEVLGDRTTVDSDRKARPRFWAHAKHIDVLLIIAATAIVGTILAAWLV